MPSAPTSSSSPALPPGGLLLDVDLPAGRVALIGDLDRGTRRQLTSVCGVLAVAGPPVWVLDVTSLAFCDAAGLRALVATRRAAVDGGAALVVVGARPYLRQLLELVGLRNVLAPPGRTVRRAVVVRC